MKFQFKLEGEHLNSSPWAYENGYIEGDLDIYINDTPAETVCDLVFNYWD